MDDSGYRGWSEEQLEQVIRGLPRREPPAGLRDRVLAQARPRRASLLRPGFAFAAFVLLLMLDAAVLRWQDADLAAQPAPRAAVAQIPAQSDDDLLTLVRETYHGRAWQLSLFTPPERAEGYLRFRDRTLNTMDRG